MLVKTLHKTAWLVAGIVFLILAIAGLLLPVIPQMPFFLAAVFCFVRCSSRFNIWLARQHIYIRLHQWAETQHWFDRIKKHLPHRQK